jgi:hypothetical protein
MSIVSVYPETLICVIKREVNVFQSGSPRGVFAGDVQSLLTP